MAIPSVSQLPHLMGGMLFVCSEPHLPHAVHRTTRRSSTDTGPRTPSLCTRARLRLARVVYTHQAIGRFMGTRCYSWECGAVLKFAI